jgi:RHS repeat-associated protein
MMDNKNGILKILAFCLTIESIKQLPLYIIFSIFLITAIPESNAAIPAAAPAFTGKEADRLVAMDDHLTVYDFGARTYMPVQGSFMSPDPVSGDVLNPLIWNRYAFCLNNPVNYVDPDGKEAFSATATALFFISPDPITKGIVLVGTAGLVAYAAVEIYNYFSEDAGTENQSEIRKDPEPNRGKAKPHGGEEHNGAIDAEIEHLK